MSFDLTGKVALVTGASQGLGARFAETLAASGVAVAVAARQVAKLEDLAERIRGAGGSAHAVAMDVTDPASVAAAIEDAEAALGSLDILVNNAGIAVQKPFLEMSPEDYDQVLDTNLKGCFLVAQAAARRMKESGGGSIINISSVLGTEVIGALSTYCASKGGLLQLNRAMALELSRYGIRVNAIAPGYIETPINSDFFKTEPGQKMVKTIPQRRLGQPDDLDGALLLLASDQGAYMTGSLITVDGGFVLR
ncbi:glucose 1-dehydrogenase [uncultured Nisaea sp.]|uniref:SDR family NAD(P)-dependent oxidoreductase n=1 Tax=uncultured Nisaea sp. TaxID=538215 RepID=UPI0030EDEC20|tara:strand:+ start:248 stop:1000 length:753 start_codon:yes stop_codon:yes gene_type:complete